VDEASGMQKLGVADFLGIWLLFALTTVIILGWYGAERWWSKRTETAPEEGGGIKSWCHEMIHKHRKKAQLRRGLTEKVPRDSGIDLDEAHVFGISHDDLQMLGFTYDDLTRHMIKALLLKTLEIHRVTCPEQGTAGAPETAFESVARRLPLSTQQHDEQATAMAPPCVAWAPTREKRGPESATEPMWRGSTASTVSTASLRVH
jgi:hypothetical protein